MATSIKSRFKKFAFNTFSSLMKRVIKSRSSDRCFKLKPAGKNQSSKTSKFFGISMTPRGNGDFGLRNLASFYIRNNQIKFKFMVH